MSRPTFRGEHPADPTFPTGQTQAGYGAPILEARSVGRTFGKVVALRDVSMAVGEGEVVALLGDNGAGKSTLIKILSGVYQPSHGQVFFQGRPVRISSPREALDLGIATVHQHLLVQPLMSVTRNFFLGREPQKGWGPLRRFDVSQAHATASLEMKRMGIDLRDPGQPAGTMSGGERQCLAIARALHFGARLLILDEPTSALGVKQAGLVLRFIEEAANRGVGVILVTHNVHHALAVAARFVILERGRHAGTFRRGDIAREELLDLMAGRASLSRP